MKKKTTATESELNALHSVVAKTINEQLTATMQVDMGDGETKEVSMATPALLAQAIKFLKDNNITATPDEDENLAELKDLLESKQKRGRLHLVEASQAASED